MEYHIQPWINQISDMHCSHFQDEVFLNYTDSPKDDFISRERDLQELSDDRGSDVELEVMVV